jgi:NAD(P)H-dependent flavin oxidoreductase YrpB (nitropropane dioxygenase family)
LLNSNVPSRIARVPETTAARSEDRTDRTTRTKRLLVVSPESAGSMPIHTDICDLFDIDHPIVQAAMGPIGTVRLAAAVSNAGGLGMVSIGSETAGPRQARQTFQNSFDVVTNGTDRSFGVNMPAGTSDMPDHVRETLDGYLEETLVSKLTDDRVNEQLKVIETSAGNPERWLDDINDVKDETDLLHFHKVASLHHAKKAVKLGVDGLTVSGFEMGGHTHSEADATGTFVLAPAVTEAVDVPVLVSGGVRDGRSLLAALALGADGVYMGSRFILTEEADFGQEYKDFVQQAGPGSDTLIEGTYGPVRVLDSPGIEKVHELKENLPRNEYMDRKDEMLAMGEQGDVEEGLIAAGQVAGYMDDRPSVSELIDRIVAEAEATYRDLPVDPA